MRYPGTADHRGGSLVDEISVKSNRRILGKGDRLGLYMTVATLIVITVTAVMLINRQLTLDERRIRSDAISIARILAGLPWEQLTAPSGALDLLQQGWKVNDFAYATVVSSDAGTAFEVTSPGVIVPPTAYPDLGSARVSEHSVQLDAATPIIEIQAPILRGTELAGRLRLGFFKPDFGMSVSELPFFATLAFFIFLLTPIFYLLIRREIRPLRDANDRLASLVQNEQLGEFDLRASGELREFIGNFNGFVRFAKERIDRLTDEQNDLHTRTKLLTYSKSRVETALESIPEAIIIVDQTGTITFASARVETLLGVKADDVLKQEPHVWCTHPELLDTLERYAAKQPSKQYLAQTVIIKPVAPTQPNLSVKAYPLFAPNNVADLHGTLIVIRDVSKEVLARESHTEFVTHVAHELKTPLNAIGLASERLLFDDELTESERVETTNIVHDEVDRMATLINNLLSITKIEMGEVPIERRHVKLRDFLTDVFENVTRSAGVKELSFELNLEHDYSTIFLDKDLLRIAVNNLLTNAIKYSDAGDTVSLTADESDDSIRIAVRDTGIGISTADQQQIFSKFYRSEQGAVRARQGHGLGLSLAAEIVDMHDGTLTVVSQPGEGSEFTITLRKEAGALQQAV